MSILDHLHPATVHFPIAFLLAGSAAGLFYMFVRAHSELRTVTWWALIVGWVTCGVAILSGVLAQRNLPPDAPYRSVLNWHISAGIATLVVYGALLYLHWLYNKERARQTRAKSGQPTVDLLDDPQRRVLTATLLVVGAALVFLSGWNGGVLVFEWGVNVVR